MTATRLLMSTMLLSLLGAACDQGGAPSQTAAPTPSASGAAASSATTQASAKPAGKCEALGCQGEGTFSEMCDCKGKAQQPPFAIKYTGKYSNFFKQPEFEVTNTTDKDIHWGSAAVYYYDKSGKQLEAQINDKTFKASRVNGSNFSLKPKETKTITLGFKQESEPKNIDAIQVVFDGWCFGTYEDKASHLCVSIDRAPDERAKAN